VLEHRPVGGRIALVFVLSCLLIAIAAAPAAAAPPSPPLPQCAQTVSPDQLNVGQKVIGYTVTHGTTVEKFDATILGIMRGGVDPGRDLIIVRASGAPIAQAGGIWFGMSGSPVYTLGGKLIGAVSYGFSSTSTIAGLTPAPDMTALLGSGASALAGPAPGAAPEPRHVPLSPAIRARVSRRPGAPERTDAGSMSQLEVPLSISGLAPQRRDFLRRQAMKDHLPFFIPAVGGSSVPGKGLSSAPMHPGDSFAAASSYGDITTAGVGTTSYVCGGQAIAFGHPFFFTGPATLGAGGATALGIVEDPVFGPFKLANVTDPIGVVQQDRLPGLQAELGVAPPLVPVTQDTKSLDTGLERTGETDVVRAPAPKPRLGLPFIATTHAFSNIDSVFDQISGGSSRISWTIRGTREPSGKHWSVTRSNRWVSNRDISFASVSELFNTLETLDHQKLARIQFSGVHIDVEVRQATRELKLHKVLWSTDGNRYRPASRLRVRPGQRLFAKVRMHGIGGTRSRTAKLKLRVPGGARGNALVFVGAENLGGGIGLGCLLSGHCRGSAKAKTFDGLIKKLESAPRNNDLVATIASKQGSSSAIKHEPEVVTGHKFLLLKIGGGHHRRRHA
jgi:hypothetical protein